MMNLSLDSCRVFLIAMFKSKMAAAFIYIKERQQQSTTCRGMQLPGNILYFRFLSHLQTQNEVCGMLSKFICSNPNLANLSLCKPVSFKKKETFLKDTWSNARKLVNKQKMVCMFNFTLTSN